MINLLQLLGLDADADPEAFDIALLEARQQAGASAEIDGIALDRIEGILGNPDRRTHYRRVHEQYVAIAVAIELLDLPGTSDSHRWRDRTVEFQSD